MNLSEIAPVLARHLRRKVTREGPGGQELYSFYTTDSVVKVFFDFLPDSEDAADVNWERPGFVQGEIKHDERSKSVQVFAMLPLAIKQFIEDHPKLKMLRFGVANKKLEQTYRKLIEKYKDSWHVVSVNDVDGNICLELSR